MKVRPFPILILLLIWLAACDQLPDEVRLQHPLGVVYADGLLYVADTYNNKIRLIDPAARSSSTFLGSGEDGWRDGDAPLFDEPGGLSLEDGLLVIADTNKHVIRIANLANRTVSALVLADPQGLLTRAAAGSGYTGKTITLDAQTVTCEADAESLCLLEQVRLQLPPTPPGEKS